MYRRSGLRIVSQLGGAQRRQIRQRLLGHVPLVDSWKVVNLDSRREAVTRFQGDLAGTEDSELVRTFLHFRTPSWMPRFGFIPLIRRVFLPVNYPSSVASNYTDFVKYNTIQVACISVGRILATQSMLLAVGVGQAGALPIAAVLNWLLKDGLGHLGSILVGSTVNVKFDSNPKRYKFLSVSFGQISNIFGILSLWHPPMFLILTSLSSVFSRIATMALVPSRVRIYSEFAIAGNLGDVIRCSQAQMTLATIIGTAVGVVIAPVLGSSFPKIITLFVPLSVFTHWAAYKAISLIRLSTFNRHRYELVIEGFMIDGSVRSPEEIARSEIFLRTPQNIFPHVLVNPEIKLEDVSEELVEQLNLRGLCRVSPNVLFTTVDALPENILREFYFACTETTNWDSFRAQLIEAGWHMDIAFIDDPNTRIILE
jgi:hypothetical protein